MSFPGISNKFKKAAAKQRSRVKISFDDENEDDSPQLPSSASVKKKKDLSAKKDGTLQDNTAAESQVRDVIL